MNNHDLTVADVADVAHGACIHTEFGEASKRSRGLNMNSLSSLKHRPLRTNGAIGWRFPDRMRRGRSGGELTGA